ncbi:MAG: hypothetical protein AAF571_13770, partial [Verrucomicrobiota bacterium]
PGPNGKTMLLTMAAPAIELSLTKAYKDKKILVILTDLSEEETKDLKTRMQDLIGKSYYIEFPADFFTSGKTVSIKSRYLEEFKIIQNNGVDSTTES